MDKSFSHLEIGREPVRSILDSNELIFEAKAVKKKKKKLLMIALDSIG